MISPPSWVEHFARRDTGFWVNRFDECSRLSLRLSIEADLSASMPEIIKRRSRANCSAFCFDPFGIGRLILRSCQIIVCLSLKNESHAELMLSLEGVERFFS